jgi:signal transduction histidine kinase
MENFRLTNLMRFSRDLAKIFSKRASHLVILLLVAIILLTTGIVAIRTEYEAIASRNLIIHTYQVRDRVATIQVARAEIRATSYAYIMRNDPVKHARLLEQIAAANLAVSSVLDLVKDNPPQIERATRLKNLINDQTSQLLACVDSVGCNASDFAVQELSEVQGREALIRAAAIAMDDEETRLVGERVKTWNALFWRNLIIISAAHFIALLLVVYSFQQLNAEVSARKELERIAQENTESFRALSARILELQDVERRKIARELHDSVGQYLAGLKMSLSQLNSTKAVLPVAADWLPETIQMTDRAIGEIRTISHLLHPPLLDELGFESTAKWYVEEFAKRSGTKVELEIGGIVERLPRGIELALFRALQEALTNVHRHASATLVDVIVSCTDGKVILEVSDNGKGIPPRTLNQFRAGGAAGIGLAGMRERLAELRGSLEVESSPAGTKVKATLPTTQCESEDEPSVSVFAGPRN